MQELPGYGWSTLPRQATIKHPIWCQGIGVHSGKQVRLDLRPSGPGTGISFVVRINGQRRAIPATWEHAEHRVLRTMIASDGAAVETIEHLMAALSMNGIDNCELELTGSNEVPILDGSARHWQFLLGCAGRVEQDAIQRAIIVTNRVTVENEHGWIDLEPHHCFSVGYAIGYDHPLIPLSDLRIDLVGMAWQREIAAARTFGFRRDEARMRSLGLARGVDLANTVIFDEQEVMNGLGLRWPDEPIRHKILDIIGDLALAGAPICGKVTGWCSGHSLNHELVRKLMTTPAAWRWS